MNNKHKGMHLISVELQKLSLVLEGSEALVKQLKEDVTAWRPDAGRGPTLILRWKLLKTAAIVSGQKSYIKVRLSQIKNRVHHYERKELDYRSSHLPPVGIQKILSILVEAQYRDGLLGDLDESFHRTAIRFGGEFARKQYCIDAVLSLPPLMGSRIAKLFSLLALMDFLRRKLGF
ncbi:MAG: hypothetical protein WDO70_03115 [Alphaproteobacteria bacterium]